MKDLFKRFTASFLTGIMAFSAVAIMPVYASAEGTSRDDAVQIELSEDYSFKTNGTYSSPSTYWYTYTPEETENGVDSWFKFTYANITTESSRYGVTIYNKKGIELESFSSLNKNTDVSSFFKLEQNETYYFCLSSQTKGETYLTVEEVFDIGGETIGEAATIKPNQTYKDSIVGGNDKDWLYVETSKKNPQIVVKNTGSFGNYHTSSVYVTVYDDENTEIKSLTVPENKTGTLDLSLDTNECFICVSGGYVEYSITVNAEVNATKVKLNKSKLTLKKGKTSTLKVTVSPTEADTKLEWKSSNTKVATVNKNGKITAKKKGTVTITVTDKNTGKKATCKVTVK